FLVNIQLSSDDFIIKIYGVTRFFITNEAVATSFVIVGNFTIAKLFRRIRRALKVLFLKFVFLFGWSIGNVSEFVDIRKHFLEGLAFVIVQFGVFSTFLVFLCFLLLFFCAFFLFVCYLC